MEVETGIEPVYKVLQTFASPLGHSTVGDFRLFHSTNCCQLGLGADDETRTRDPHLGKVMRYQLRYIRSANVRLHRNPARIPVRDTGIEPVTPTVSR